MTKKAIIEGAKEIARLVIFALPGIAIQVVSKDPELSLAWGGAILAILRGWDKGVHDDKTIQANGLLPF